MLNSQQKIALLPSAIAAVMLAACGAPATPAQTATAAPTATAPPKATAPPTATEGIPAGAYPEIARLSLEEAKAAFDEGSAIFVDVRWPTDYEAAHIQGAINIPFRDVDERLGELDKAKWIITYCV